MCLQTLESLFAAPDHIVALQLHRSLEEVVGVLGTLMSGAAYLPLDPKWPLDRRQFMIEDAECKLVVAQSLHSRELTWFGGAVLHLDDARSHPVAKLTALGPIPFHPTPPTAQVQASERTAHLAYVMYTSGSTGTPKGVTVAHAGVVNLLHATQPRFSEGQSLIFGLSTVYIFDVFVHVVFTALGMVGAKCVLLEDGKSLLTLDLQVGTELEHQRPP